MDAKTYPVTHTDAEWRKLLTPEQYHIMREHGTERPGSCALNFEKRAGTFTCAGCDQPLFVSKKKFESGTGWPSFNDPRAGCGRDDRGPQLRHDAHRGALQPLRQPSRPRLRRRPAADRPALLHQRRRHELRAGVSLALSSRNSRGSKIFQDGTRVPSGRLGPGSARASRSGRDDKGEREHAEDQDRPSPPRPTSSRPTRRPCGRWWRIWPPSAPRPRPAGRTS